MNVMLCGKLGRIAEGKCDDFDLSLAVLQGDPLDSVDRVLWVVTVLLDRSGAASQQLPSTASVHRSGLVRECRSRNIRRLSGNDDAREGGTEEAALWGA